MNSTYLPLVAVVALVASLAVSSEAKSAGIFGDQHASWYDCDGKRDGNYVHPHDCTRFMTCSNGYAYQRDCASCHVDPVRCPTGRTVYNQTTDACLWADETICGGDGGNSGNRTEAPPPQTTTTTKKPPTEESGFPAPGSPCVKSECVNKGYCDWYMRCEGGVWVNSTCGRDLLWNPFQGDADSSESEEENIHGGNCDIAKKLPEELLEEYWSDGSCLKCEWAEVTPGSCSKDYLYRPYGGYKHEHEKLSCRDGLVFLQDKETCGNCEEYKGANCTCSESQR